MKLFKFLGTGFLFGVLTVMLSSCQRDSPCERYYIPENFTGEVTVYYEQEKGQKKLDSEKCIVHNISDSGNCFSAWPYQKDGTIVTPGKTYRFFLVDSNGIVATEIFDFNASEHPEDVSADKKKYIGRYFGGVRNGKYVSGFYVGYRANFVN